MVRRGSTGDDSDNDFGGVGGGSSTDTGTGSTGDDSDNDFGSGGTSDPGGTSGSPGDTGAGDGVGGDDDDDGDDTTYGGGGSSTTAPSGVTGDRGRDTTSSGSNLFGSVGGADPATGAPEGETGRTDPQDNDRGVGMTTTPSGETVVEGDRFSPTVGDTSDRGVGIARNRSGTTVVIPQPDASADDLAGSGQAVDAADVTAATQRQRDAQPGGLFGVFRPSVGRSASPGAESSSPVGPLDYAVDAAFQDSEEVAPLFGLDSPAAREDRVNLGGPTLGTEPGQREPVNTTITDALTEGRGRFSEETVARRRQLAEGYQEYFGIGAEAEQFVNETTGNRAAANLAGGLGELPGAVAAAPSAGALTYDTAWKVGRNLPETVDEYGATAVGDAAVDTTGAIFQSTTRNARQNPYETAGRLIGEVLLGTAALRGASSVGDRVRSARVRRQADETVPLEEITSERGAEGDLPQFETDPGAPTGEAVSEVRDRAADNPDTVLDAVNTDRALFHSTEADLGDGFEATRGSSELPGLFTSPDASPLRIDEDGGSSLSDTEFRLPRASDFTGGDDRFAAFEGDRIEGMPEDATGSGRIPDGDGGYDPDPETSGAQFLDEQAAEGTAFVRPQGGRTPELEAIFPPGSRFEAAEGRESVGERLGDVSLASEPMDSRDVFGRPLAQDVGAEIASEPMDSRDVFGRPLAQDADAEIASEPMDSRDVFGRPLASDVGATPLSQRLTPSSSSQTTSRDVFGRPLASDVGATAVSERFGSALGRLRGVPPGRDVTPGTMLATPDQSNTVDVFGRPLAADVGTAAVSERVSSALGRLRDVPPGRDIDPGSMLATPDQPNTVDVFGRPLASDVGERSVSERIGRALPKASEPMDSRDIFGRPVAQDVTRPSGGTAVELPSGRAVPLDVFRRADTDAGDMPDDVGDGGTTTRTADEISEELSRRGDASGSPVVPTLPGVGSAGSDSTSSTGAASSSGLPTLGDLTSSFGGSTSEAGSGSSFASSFDEFLGSSGGGPGSSFSSPGGSDSSVPSSFSAPPSGSPSSPSGPSSGTPSSPSSPSSPTSGTPSLPGSPGTPSSPGPRDDERREQRDDSPFAYLLGERTFDSGIDDAEAASATFFGGEETNDPRPPTDTTAERRVFVSSETGREELGPTPGGDVDPLDDPGGQRGSALDSLVGGGGGDQRGGGTSLDTLVGGSGGGGGDALDGMFGSGDRDGDDLPLF